MLRSRAPLRRPAGERLQPAIFLCVVLWSLGAASTSLAAGGGMYRGFGLLVPRTSVEGEFNDTILLSSSTAVVDVPSVSDFTEFGVSWMAHELPSSGLGGGVELGFFRGTTSAPGLLAPPGGYDSSHWNVYLDLVPGFWVPLGPGEGSPVGLALAGRAGVGFEHLKIDESATKGAGLLDASYRGFRFRYGGGARLRLGRTTSRPIVIAAEWVRNRGSYSSVNVSGDDIKLQDKLDGPTTDILLSVGFLLFTPNR